MECPEECWRWATYLGYCLCKTKDVVSLALGLISVISWGVAEIPQIVTNFKSKSTDGLSFLFLLTWIIGDFLNMFGCMLEPSTLPTQFYMALLYTINTMTLALQSVYYGHIYPRLKTSKQFHKAMIHDQSNDVEQYSQDDSREEEKLVDGTLANKPKPCISTSATAITSPIPLPALPRHSAEHDSYYMSARSLLSTSHTPRRHSYSVSHRAHLDSIEKPLLGGSLPANQVRALKTRSLFCVVSALTFIVGTMDTASPRHSKVNLVLQMSSNRHPRTVNRKLLQVGQQHITSGDGGHSSIGSYLGWAMAVLYMGGRLPQICLNIRRGNVEGLNPFMFVFALLGNTTYVASILVNSLEWSKLMPNLPWLVDAGGCVLLDTFILLQFIYFQYWLSRHLVVKQ